MTHWPRSHKYESTQSLTLSKLIEYVLSGDQIPKTAMICTVRKLLLLWRVYCLQYSLTPHQCPICCQHCHHTKSKVVRRQCHLPELIVKLTGSILLFSQKEFTAVLFVLEIISELSSTRNFCVINATLTLFYQIWKLSNSHDNVLIIELQRLKNW